MEQYEDIKNELKQELQDLQQNIEQHSTFHSDVWQRSVKRYSRQLYWQNMTCVIILIVIITASNLILLEEWPWWLLLPVDLLVSMIVVDSLIATNGLRKADVQSREGLLSLRESVHKSTTYSKRKRILIQVIGIIGSVMIYVYLFFHDRLMFFTLLITSLIFIPIGRLTGKRVKKRYDELDEEIDELMKEE